MFWDFIWFSPLNLVMWVMNDSYRFSNVKPSLNSNSLEVQSFINITKFVIIKFRIFASLSMNEILLYMYLLFYCPVQVNVSRLHHLLEWVGKYIVSLCFGNKWLQNWNDLNMKYLLLAQGLQISFSKAALGCAPLSSRCLLTPGLAWRAATLWDWSSHIQAQS